MRDKQTGNYFGLILLIAIVLFSLHNVPQYLFASESPYPPSPLIKGITWDHPTTIVRKALGSDNFPMTWADDGNLYTVWGDGGGFGGSNTDGRVSLGVGRIEGSPQKFVAHNIFGGKNSEVKATFGGKSYGILSVNKTLYMWVGPGSTWEANKQTRLAWSHDHGKTWQLSEVFFRYTDGFSSPTFLNFGCDYAGARDKYVYVYAYDASNGPKGPYTKVNLLRVPKDRIKNRAAYEFFKGNDAMGSPLWTKDVSQREPVFLDQRGGVFIPSVSYNPGIGRYLAVIPHQRPTHPYGGLGVFDAPEPWGPWTTVEYTDSWMGSKHMFFVTFPTKWISPDGLTLYLVFSGYGKDPVARDAYQHIRGILNILDTKTQTVNPK